MRTLLRLSIAAILVNASWQAGTVYWRYHKFRDDVQETAEDAGNKTVPDLQSRVLEIAAELEVPLAANQVNVRQEQNRTFIDATYTDEIELLPTYSYPWQATVKVDAFRVASDLIPAQ